MITGHKMLQRAPALLPAMRSRSQLVVAMAKQNKQQAKKEGGGGYWPRQRSSYVHI